MENKLAKNVFISIFVQIVSLIVSFIIGFIVPRFIDEYQYAYWQTYILYVGYVGVLHLGLLDGIVLRYSQYDFDQIDKETIRSQFIILLCLISTIAIIVFVVGSLFADGISREIILFVAIGIITKNISTYNSYTFQITNRISEYALFTIIHRLSYGLITVLFLLLHVNQFEFYCVADLFGDFIGIVFSKFFNRGMYFGKSLNLRESLKECKLNIYSGAILMLANWSAMLLVSFAKMIVQWHWNELTFGKVSFSFSLSNLFLTFITAVSVVVFPQLKRTTLSKLPEIYKNIRSFISPFLFVVMLAYYPGCSIIERVLPKYSQSLIYLGVLLPIIIFTSKVSLLTNNFLKAYRKEKDMLRINIISSILAIISFAISAYILNSLIAVLLCVVFSNLVKSVLSEQVVAKEIGMSFAKDHLIETVMTVIFILNTYHFSRWVACAIYALALIVYLAYYRKSIFVMIQSVFPKIKYSK